MMSKKGIGYVTANGSNINIYGEKKVVGYPDNGEGVVLKILHADVKKVLGSAHKVYTRGSVVVLEGERSCILSEKAGQKTSVKHEDGQYVMYMLAPSREDEVREESEKALKSAG